MPDRGMLRRRAMMDAAWSLLLEKGLAGITLNDIIQRSGGSRSTLYSSFGDKDGLVRAVLAEQCELFCEELHISLRADQPPHQALTRFALTLTEHLEREETHRFVQVLFAEGAHFSSVVEVFAQQGPEVTHKLLTDYLQRQIELGRLQLDAPRHAAEMFSAMVTGDWHKQVVHLAQPRRLSTQERHQRVQQTVSLFLRGAATPHYRDTLDV